MAKIMGEEEQWSRKGHVSVSLTFSIFSQEAQLFENILSVCVIQCHGGSVPHPMTRTCWQVVPSG